MLLDRNRWRSFLHFGCFGRRGKHSLSLLYSPLPNCCKLTHELRIMKHRFKMQVEHTHTHMHTHACMYTLTGYSRSGRLVSNQFQQSTAVAMATSVNTLTGSWLMLYRRERSKPLGENGIKALTPQFMCSVFLGSLPPVSNNN